VGPTPTVAISWVVNTGYEVYSEPDCCKASGVELFDGPVVIGAFAVTCRRRKDETDVVAIDVDPAMLSWLDEALYCLHNRKRLRHR
jgi:hypothetical protein